MGCPPDASRLIHPFWHGGDAQCWVREHDKNEVKLAVSSGLNTRKLVDWGLTAKLPICHFTRLHDIYYLLL